MQDSHPIEIASAASAAAAKGLAITLTGAGTSVAGGMAASEIAAWVGAVVALTGLAVTWYYQREAHKLRLIEHQARMAAFSELSDE